MTVQTVDSGQTTSFSVSPDTDYSALVGGTCGGALSGTTYTTSAITSDCTVIASFTLNTYIVSTSIDAGEGNATPQWLNMGHGESALFTITPRTGYDVESVTGCGGIWTGSNPFETAEITEECTVSIRFSVFGDDDDDDDDDSLCFPVKTINSNVAMICL